MEALLPMSHFLEVRKDTGRWGIWLCDRQLLDSPLLFLLPWAEGLSVRQPGDPSLYRHWPFWSLFRQLSKALWSLEPLTPQSSYSHSKDFFKQFRSNILGNHFHLTKRGYTPPDGPTERLLWVVQSGQWHDWFKQEPSFALKIVCCKHPFSGST